MAATTLVAGPYAILRSGAGLTGALWRVRLIIAAGMGFGISSSPGGGGPGQSLTSTNPPPSVEEVGRMITEDLDSGNRDYDQNGRSRCPKGYYWDYRKRKCVKRRKD